MCEHAYIAGVKLLRRSKMAQFPKEIELEVHATASWSIVRPGDTLLVAVNKEFSMQEAEDIKIRLQELLPGVMVLRVQASQLMVYRPDKNEWIKKNSESQEPYRKIYGPGDMDRSNCLPDCPGYVHEH